MDHILVTTIPSWLTKPWVHLQMDKSVVQVIRHSEPTQAYVSLQMKLILCTSIIKGNHPVSTISNGHICGTAIPLCSANPLEHIWTQVLKLLFLCLHQGVDLTFLYNSPTKSLRTIYTTIEFCNYSVVLHSIL